jgi:hypothetical protein
VDHLWGRHTVGVYPLLPDESCWFLAMDFDQGSWCQDAAAISETCRGEAGRWRRSVRGDGAHVWSFFSSPVRASTARRMGSHLLAQTMACRTELPVESYGRLFPNQDTMPRGGFGNLIALPFQHEPRQQGNTVFRQDDWTPYPDQWEFLAGLSRLDPRQVSELSQKGLPTLTWWYSGSAGPVASPRSPECET